MEILEQTGDLYGYIEAAETYVTIGMNFYESIEYLVDSAKKLISTLMGVTKDYDRALKLVDGMINFLKREQKTDSKQLADILYLRLMIKRMTHDYKFIVSNIQECEKVTLNTYGETSGEYVDVLIEVAYSKSSTRKMNEAYITLLKAYDINKEVFGDENNCKTPTLLGDMAVLKVQLQQVDEGLSFINKAKEIEQKMTSKDSMQYKSLVSLENKIIEMTQQTHGVIDRVLERRRRLRNRQLWNAVKPDTPLKVSGYVLLIATMIAGGAYLYKKNTSAS